MFKYRHDQFEFPCEEGTEFVQSFVSPLLVPNIEDHGVYGSYDMVKVSGRLCPLFSDREPFQISNSRRSTVNSSGFLDLFRLRKTR